MQLTPRYDTDPLIVLDGPPSAIAEPCIRQRQRLAATVASFTDEQWSHPSRCEGWSNRDVIVHLDTTNTFWTYAISEGLRGSPTRLLASFDPVATPAELVAGTGDLPPHEVLERFAASTAALIDRLESIDDDRGWTAVAEAPPGHLQVSAVAHHALWDGWVHERDVLLPVGLAAEEVDDEVAGALRYAAALGPAFAVSRGRTERAVLAVEATRPDLSFVVETGDQVEIRTVAGGATDAALTLRGPAVDLLEALSLRRPLDQEVAADAAWLVDGLAVTFDARPA